MSELLSSQRLHSINTQRCIITHYAKKDSNVPWFMVEQDLS